MTKRITQKKSLKVKKLSYYFAASVASLSSAAPALAQFGDQAKEGVQDVGGTSPDGDVEVIIQNIVNVLLFLVGAVSVIMIIIGGLRYILSNGDQQQAANARNTVLYSVIGLAVAVLAWAIVNYVLGELY